MYILRDVVKNRINVSTQPQKDRSISMGGAAMKNHCTNEGRTISLNRMD